MKINYWDCKYSDYGDWWDDNECEFVRCYGCAHPDNKARYCDKDNQWNDDTEECSLAEEGCNE